MRTVDQAAALLADGFGAIREQFGIPTGFPADVLVAAQEAATRRPGTGRRDARDLPFVTLDPAGSVDLDQAFVLSAVGDDVVLHYAIADVGFWVDRGGPIEAEAWRRGTTIYAPDGKAPLHPTVLSQGAASLLPGGDRPAVLLTVAVAPDGHAVLRGAERALVRSRTKLGYESVTPGDLPPLFGELARRVSVAEEARGSNRVDFPEQEVIADPAAPGGLRLRARPRVPAEDGNAALSLAANLAVADAMLAARTGLFRVMAEPDERAVAQLRRTARALDIAWPEGASLRQLHRSLDPTDAKHAAFLLAARRAGGGASYAVYDRSAPWHTAVAATYAHATAPLRRLADRYVLDVVCTLQAGAQPSADDVATLARLPAVMERADRLAAQVDRAAIDLVEAVTLSGREGEVFDAVVIDAAADDGTIQLVDPPVRARLASKRLEPAEHVRVRLARVDPAKRQVRFERVS